MSEPKVSIIMGIYNCESTLKDSIESIINQTYTNWELIMCDDCSKDKTFEIAQYYKNKYNDKIILLKNESNLTLGPTLNRCLKYASGKYIARQDGDDLSHRDRLKIQVNFLEKNCEYDLVGTNMISFDNNGENGIHRKVREANKENYLKYGVIFYHATIMMKSSTMKNLGGYSDKWYTIQAEDFELWARFIEQNYKGINIDENLYYVREDIDAYKRRNIKRRLRLIILRFIVNKRLKAHLYLYFFILKDIIAIFIPRNFFIKYYKKRTKKR